MSNTPTTLPAHNKPAGLKMILSSESVQSRIKEVLGARAPQFCSSVVSLVNANDRLMKADPNSVVAACMTAALLNLPISKDLGFAHIVPYSGVAQFQMGYKGFVQLAMRTGQYRHLNACAVYDGELVKYDRLTGELVLDELLRSGDKIVGWAAYMELVNGFRHALYWTDEQMEAHAKRFSQAVKQKKTDSPWFTNRETMCLKTVLKALLSKWGILSIELERALHEDQGIKRNLNADTEFIDNQPPERAPIAEPKALPDPTPEPEHHVDQDRVEDSEQTGSETAGEETQAAPESLSAIGVITEVHPPRKGKSNKLGPYKVKLDTGAEGGRMEFDTFDKPLGESALALVGKDVAVRYKEVVNGQYTNNELLSVTEG